MSRKHLISVTAALSLLAAPAAVQAAGPPSDHPTASNNPGTTHKPAGTPTPPDHPTATDNPGTVDRPSAPEAAGDSATPGPAASASAKARAYGTFCKAESKKPVKGQKGTAFSKCVTAMAKLASGKTSDPTTACKALSKKRVAGQKGTPFSKCVSAAAKMKAEQADEQADEPAPAAPIEAAPAD